MSIDMSAAIAAVRKEYGPDAIQMGDVIDAVSFIPTGSLELDFAMGGGVPIGRFSRFYGPSSSGKSLVCWQTIASAQRMGMSCAYYNIEKQYDPDFARSMGVDVSKLVVVQGTIIEEIATSMETLMQTIDVHVLDSASSAVSIEELNAKAEDQTIALGARTWGRMLRRLLERFDVTRNTAIIVDQVRSSIRFGASDEPPGGRMMEHTSSMTVMFTRGGWLWRGEGGYLYDKKRDEKGLGDLLEPDGIEYQARVRKSRVGRPFRTARCYYDFSQRQFDDSYEYFMAARFFKIVQQGGGWYTLPDGTKLQGEAKLRAAIAGDDKLKKLIRDTVMAHAR